MITKRLIFAFYCFKDYENNRAIKIHLNCLKYYANVFDESIFILSVDDINDKNLINEIEKLIIDCGYRNVTFKIVQNTNYYEAKVFYENVILHLKDFEGITFWGHNKGISNYEKGEKISIDNWICGLYYLSLSNIKEVEKKMISGTNRFYGSFLIMTDGLTKNGYIYSGTFFWLNGLSIYEELYNNHNYPPLPPNQRGYAENFPGNLYTWENGNVLGSIDRKVLYPLDFYYNLSDETMSFLLSNNFNDFIEYKNKMINF